MVDALFIDPRGVYPKLLGPEHCWGEDRDARTYAGSGPVLLHPPCAAWCLLAGVREARYGYPRGEDGGLFAFALETLRRCGGVLEHPAYSKAWDRYGLTKPRKGEGWLYEGEAVGGGVWVCQVSQCAYGHAARKRTWLIYVGGRAPYDLNWSEPFVSGSVVISGSNNHGVNPSARRMWTREAKATPPLFAAELISLAEWSKGVDKP